MPLPNSPILQSPLMAQSDTNKYVLFNDAMVKLEDSINRALIVDMTAGNVTLTESQLLNYGIIKVSTGASAYILTIPNTVGSSPAYATNRVLVIRNDGATSSLTVSHTGGNTVTVAQGYAVTVYADGTDIEQVGGQDAASAAAAAASAAAALVSEGNAATSETNAATSESNAADSAAAALVSEGNADTSETNSAASAAAALVSEGNASDSEIAAAASEAAAALSEANIDLGAIADTKGITAVDGFVYDTSLDSDGGAWRTGARALASSWYWETLNTATRGARKEFPAVAVIIAESNKITIYDGDDPLLPMWAVWIGDASPGTQYAWLDNVANVTSVIALDGQVFFGIDDAAAPNRGGVCYINLIANEVGRYGTLPTRGGHGLNAASGTKTDELPINHTVSVVNAVCNDVAITVLPDAPIDESTGLPTPTIAIATDGGVSVITDGGDVWDITNYGAGPTHIEFITPTRLLTTGYWLTEGVMFDVPSADSDVLVIGTRLTGATVPARVDGGGNFSDVSAGNNQLAFGGSGGGGLTILAEDTTTSANGMVAYLTSEYNTGWMQGDIKACLLSSTAITSLVENSIVDDMLSDNTANWSAIDNTLSFVTDHYLMTWVADTQYIHRTYPITAGETYYYKVTVKDGTASAVPFVLRSSTSVGYVIIEDFASGTSDASGVTIEGYFTTTLAADNISLCTNLTSGDLQVSDFEIRLAVEDRSVNNNGIGVHGTIARTVVATGAELVAYSGFSATDYLEQPYNADLDFGTGDFHVTGWIKEAPNTLEECVFGRDSLTTAQRFRLSVKVTGEFQMLYDDDTTTLTHSGTVVVDNGSWTFFAILKDGTTSRIYINGAQDNTLDISTVSNTLSNTAAILEIGNTSAINPLTNGSLALIRIGASAPSAAQIAKMYEDEKHLFQENALATISADAVTSLAVDPFTGLLEVGTAGDIDTISGITPIKRSTDDAGTFISIADELRISQ